jgi:hypothetical protein
MGIESNRTQPMHKEEMEGGARIELRGNQPEHKEEMKGGTRIK